MTSPIPDLDAVVIGAGVIGLAVARELAAAGREVLIVDAAADIGTGTSSRNSEVIHSGIYYPAGSLKARACVTGRELLYRYCAQRGVSHRRIGKLIVATTDAQLSALDAISAAAVCNGVDDLVRLTGPDVEALEPHLAVRAALWAPSTGIIDSHGFMRALLADARADGAELVLKSRVVGIDSAGPQLFSLTISSAGTIERVTCRSVVNCAGLDAWAVARSVNQIAAQTIPPRFLAKGNYFTLASGRIPLRHLVYPVPVDGGLGVHLTLDLAGSARFGPDVQWLHPADDLTDPYDYSVDPQRAQSFYAAIRTYWPDLPDDGLVPAYSGIRPKLGGPGQPAADFMLHDATVHGVDGLLNLFGIESPGLTSSLALAQLVAQRL